MSIKNSTAKAAKTVKHPAAKPAAKDNPANATAPKAKAPKETRLKITPNVFKKLSELNAKHTQAAAIAQQTHREMTSTMQTFFEAKGVDIKPNTNVRIDFETKEFVY